MNVLRSDLRGNGKITGVYSDVKEKLFAGYT